LHEIGHVGRRVPHACREVAAQARAMGLFHGRQESVLRIVRHGASARTGS
jgi:hypothetical protein